MCFPISSRPRSPRSARPPPLKDCRAFGSVRGAKPSAIVPSITAVYEHTNRTGCSPADSLGRQIERSIFYSPSDKLRRLLRRSSGCMDRLDSPCQWQYRLFGGAGGLATRLGARLHAHHCPTAVEIILMTIGALEHSAWMRRVRERLRPDGVSLIQGGHGRIYSLPRERSLLNAV
jgi:hypothetical protein